MTDAGRPTPGPHQPPGGGGGGDAYLWDRSGPVDAGVREVEAAAAGLGHGGAWKAVEARARGVRMARVRGLAAAVVVVLAVVGVWVGWPSGVTSYANKNAVWRFEIAHGVGMTRQPLTSESADGSLIRITTAGHPLELRAANGAVVTMDPNSEVTFTETSLAAGNGAGLSLVRGKVVVASGGSTDVWLVLAGEESVEVEPGGVIVAEAGQRGGRVVVEAGEALLMGRPGKTSWRERMIAGTGVDLGADAGWEPVLAQAASSRFVDSIRKWRSVDASDGETLMKLRMDLLNKIVESATPDDVATLWNLAFEVSYDEHEREVLIGAIGRLTGEWPAVIKSTKEPYWSQTFAEEWWEVVKRAHERRMKEDAAAKTAPPVRKGGEK